MRFVKSPYHPEPQKQKDRKHHNYKMLSQLQFIDISVFAFNIV
jgi:hypothetical protein